MDLNGDVTLEAPPEAVYATLTNPESLLKTMPGLKALTPDGPGRYQAVMEIGVSAVRGRYTGVMEIRDPDPPRRYRLWIQGQGPGAFVTVDLTVALAPDSTDPARTHLHHEGQAQVGGTLAGVGQRVVGSVASMILQQFFQAVGREAQKAATALAEEEGDRGAPR
jgi:carbon monoxide dehydrogenase subunit G